MNAREHARLLGLFFWIFAGFQFLIIGFVALIYIGVFGAVMSEVGKIPRRANEPNPEAIFGFVIVIMIIVLAATTLLLIPKIVAGYGLRNDKSWAKIWAIIACCLAVLSFPIGTALGVYGFWFIFGEAGKAYFDNPARLGNNPPPPPNSWQ